MQRLIDVYAGWPLEWQTGFACGVAILATGIVRYALWAVAVILRGHPPTPPPVVPRQECYRSCNLTGYCLKPNGCKTEDECNHTLELHTLAMKERDEFDRRQPPPS